MTTIDARWQNSAAFLPGMILIALILVARSAAQPVLHVETDPMSPAIAFLSWDTEGGKQARMNLLRSGSVIRVCVAGEWLQSEKLQSEKLQSEKLQSEKLQSENQSKCSRYHLSPADDITLTWTVEVNGADLSIILAGEGAGLDRVEAIKLIFPFDPRVTATTVLPSNWAEDGTLRLPALISAPDFGQMVLTADSDTPQRRVTGRLEGSRTQLTVDFILQLPAPSANTGVTLRLSPCMLPAPEGLRDRGMWEAARRGWFNMFQCTARWGDRTKPYSAPPGVLANNVLSDPASCSLWFYADQALWTPELAPGVSIARIVRNTTDWWLQERMLPSGEMICYWDKTGFLDANTGILIAAWDYMEMTDDDTWLAQRIEQLEKLADFLAQRDVDGDGFVEARRSGNRGTLLEPERSCCWWDGVNYGHKCGYSNALIYRAWRCMADLEQRLDRAKQAKRYTHLADRLKDVYVETLYNPRTGWLAGWKSQDGELHDYAFTSVNGMAIEYGLVEPAQGRQILARLREKMEKAGFDRFELGIPSSLIPIQRADYLITTLAGGPQREDGSDTFGQYMNGGISAGHALHFLAAHYVVGEQEQADRILGAMLSRQQRGVFQNGVVNHYPNGIDWTDWQGKAAGYEGYLADSFRFLQAVLLREPEFRQRLLRPLQ